jgi:hypothetical protein
MAVTDETAMTGAHKATPMYSKLCTRYNPVPRNRTALDRYRNSKY